MAMEKERVFIRGARLSFPAIAEPKDDLNGRPKYGATFLLDPANPHAAKSIAAITAAEKKVAARAFGVKAAKVLADPTCRVIKNGDLKEYDGYAGMQYVASKSSYKVEARGPSGELITDTDTIRSLFVAGYRVNGYIDIFAYNTSGKRGVSSILVAVQFAGIDGTFGGAAATSASDYPDMTQEVQAAGGMPSEAKDDDVAEYFDDLPPF